jgi:hypothetical protein
VSRANIIRRIVERDVGNLGVAEEKVQQEDAELYHAACEHFGTWETALQYAGVTNRRSKPQAIRQPRHKRRISVASDANPAAVISALRAMCVHGYNLSPSNNSRRDRKLYDAARRHFGSWKEALTAAGINLENSQLPAKPRRIPRADLLAQIHERHAAGKSMVWKQVCLENRAFATAVKNAFKSWYRALLAAGLATPSPSDGE